MKLTARLVEVDQMVSKSSQVLKEDAGLTKYQSLVEELTIRIEKVQQENTDLKNKL